MSVTVFMRSSSRGGLPLRFGRRADFPAPGGRPGRSVLRRIRAGASRSYDHGVRNPAALVASLPHGLAARVAALPGRRQEQVQDAGLAVALAVVNVVALLPYGDDLHPAWLAILLVIAQALPLAWRRSHPVGAAFVIGAARVAYDRIGFGFPPFPL